MYALGSVAVGLIMPAEALQDNYSDALFEAFAILGSYFGIGDGITRFVGLIRHMLYRLPYSLDRSPFFRVYMYKSALFYRLNRFRNSSGPY